MGGILGFHWVVTARLNPGNSRAVRYNPATTCLLHRLHGGQTKSTGRWPSTRPTAKITKEDASSSDSKMEREDYVPWLQRQPAGHGRPTEDHCDRQRAPSSQYWHRRFARNKAGRQRIPARTELHVLLAREESWRAEDTRSGLCSEEHLLVHHRAPGTERLLTLRMTARLGVLIFVCAYASTLCSAADEDQFYDALESIV